MDCSCSSSQLSCEQLLGLNVNYSGRRADCWRVDIIYIPTQFSVSHLCTDCFLLYELQAFSSESTHFVLSFIVNVICLVSAYTVALLHFIHILNIGSEKKQVLWKKLPMVFDLDFISSWLLNFQPGNTGFSFESMFVMLP